MTEVGGPGPALDPRRRGPAGRGARAARAVRRGPGVRAAAVPGRRRGLYRLRLRRRARAAAGGRGSTTWPSPTSMLGLYDWVIAWDHRLGDRVDRLDRAAGDRRPRDGARAGQRLAMVRERLAAGAAGPASPARLGAGAAPAAGAPRRPPIRSSGSTARSRSGSAPPSPTAAISTRWPGCASTSSRATSSRPISRSGSRRRCVEPPFDLYRRLRRPEPRRVRRLSRLRRPPGAERLARSDFSGSTRTAATSRPGRSRAPARAGWARCTTRRSAARSRRATRIGPRT